MSRVSVPWLTICSAQDPPQKKRGPVPWLATWSALWFLGASVAESLGATWLVLKPCHSCNQVPWLVASLQAVRVVCNTRKLTNPCALTYFTCTAALPCLLAPFLVSLALPHCLTLFHLHCSTWPFLPFLHCPFLAHSCTADWPTVFRTLTVVVWSPHRTG